MKRNKHLNQIIVLALLLTGISTSVYATNVYKENDKPFLYYNFGDEIKNTVSETDNNYSAVNSSEGLVNEEAEVIEEKMLYYFISEANDVYQLSKEQFNEVIQEKNINEVVQRDNVAKVNTGEVTISSNTDEIIEDYYVSELARLTGRWNFDHELNIGVKMRYSRPGGNFFEVDTGETIMFTLEPDQACSLSFGVTGSTTFDESAYIDKKNYFGITLGSENPGSYKFYCQNDSDVDLNVTGAIIVE